MNMNIVDIGRLLIILLVFASSVLAPVAAIVYFLLRRRRRRRRIMRDGKYANLTVLEMSLGESRGLWGVWVNMILSVELPDGQTHRFRERFEVNPDRIEEVQPGKVLRARVDPLGGTYGNGYILFSDLDYHRNSKSQGVPKR